MSAVPVRGRLGALTLDQVRELRAASSPGSAIASLAGVSAKRCREVLHALGLAYPPGGARANAGRKAIRRCAAVGGRW